jgi:hypothetical protein
MLSKALNEKALLQEALKEQTLLAQAPRRRGRSARPPKQRLKSVSEQEAAILKAMRAIHPVQAKVEDLTGKLLLSEKSIRTYLKSLRTRKLVTKPQGKLGRALTDAGLKMAGKLPAGAGARLFR